MKIRSLINIKYISIIATFAITIGCETIDESYQVPEFRLIKSISSELKKTYGITLYSYGINHNLPKTYKNTNRTVNFLIGYTEHGTQDQVIPLNQARCLITSVTETLLHAINTDPTVSHNLERYPLPIESLSVHIYFSDENNWTRGNGGIACVDLHEGQVKYQRYEIYEYTPPHINGKYFDVLKEPYEKALETAKEQRCLNPI